MRKIHDDRLCELLEVDPQGLAKLIRHRGLPNSVDSDEHGPFWPITTIRGWINATDYRPLHSLLLNLWPDAERPADYRGAEPVRYHGTDPTPAAVLHHWPTSSDAAVVVCWPMRDRIHLGGYLRDWVPGVHAYLTIGIGWDIYGADVFARRGYQAGDGDEDIQ